ncbi:hypothetical protein [Plesiomonas sp.]|uniref:hypothetical protein n=1 Tax=Plesiomonas sp. TaxID=2486279 RepID=UPI003F2D1092
MKLISYLPLRSVLHCLCIALPCSALADVRDSSLNAYVGIAPALELSCTDLHFGIWRVETGERGGATTVTVAAAPNARVHREGGRATLSESGTLPSASVCQLNGINELQTADASVTAVGDKGLAFVGMESDLLPRQIHVGKPSAVLSADLHFSTSKPHIKEGVAIFYVGGTLVIPDNIEKESYGQYNTINPMGVLLDGVSNL